MRMIIKKSRRNEIKESVVKTLGRLTDCSLPVDIKVLCKTHSNIRVIPFSIQMKRRGIDYEKMIEYCETNDACVDFYADFDKYIIYYNDIDKVGMINSNRYRWSLAHELGHIVLCHHKKYNQTRIFRSSLTDQVYDYLEAEADYFAQLILVPHIPLYAFKIRTKRELMYLCKISSPAANRRFIDYNLWRNNVEIKDFFDKKVFYLYYNYLYTKECNNCECNIIQRYGKFCPICGKKSLQWGKKQNMKYKLLPTDENNKLLECPKCKNEETEIEGPYCQICGTNLINECTAGFDCTILNPLPTNARYCPVCGNKSSFYNTELLKDWDYVEPSTPVIGFMDIPDGIDEELPFK